jgi:N-acylneuraminate cytidylyltransferase
MVVSVKESKANPYFNLFEEQPTGFLKKSKEGNYTRRQDAPKIWEYNGAIYIISIEALLRQPIGSFERVRKYVMAAGDSADIDSREDFEIVERIISTR